MNFREQEQIRKNKKRFYNKSSKYVMEETKKDIKDSIFGALNEGDGIDEYGHVRKEIYSFDLYYDQYLDHNIFTFYGHHGNDGIRDTFILDNRVNINELKEFLNELKNELQNMGYIGNFKFDYLI